MTCQTGVIRGAAAQNTYERKPIHTLGAASLHFPYKTILNTWEVFDMIYECEELGYCPHMSADFVNCRVHCGLGADEDDGGEGVGAEGGGQ